LVLLLGLGFSIALVPWKFSDDTLGCVVSCS